jgi:archaellum component FlaG (FlaF/FlaG flagellin family)
MSDTVIIAIIGAVAGGLPTVATIITALLQARTSNRHNAKQSIFQMIMEDKVAVLYGGIPSNYQNILNEYDIYHKNGGNSYVTEKVEAYKKWYIQWQASHIDK